MVICLGSISWNNSLSSINRQIFNFQLYHERQKKAHEVQVIQQLSDQGKKMKNSRPTVLLLW